MSNPSIAADKTPWYQWDTGLTVTVSGGAMTECHFANRKQGTAYVQAVINGVARVPDELLQVAAPIKAYGYVSDGAGGQTYVEQSFEVIARNIPADYTYTKTAQKTIHDAEVARDEAVQSAIDASNAKEAVQTAKAEAEKAKDAAVTSASNAAESADSAAKSASDAATSVDSINVISPKSVAVSPTAEGSGAIAIGGDAHANGDAAYALGTTSQAVTRGVAIGQSATVNIAGSVAIGAGSVSNKVNEVSIGNNNMTREITCVSTPTTPASAATKAYVDGINTITPARMGSSTVTGDLSFAIGPNSRVSGVTSMAIGGFNTVANDYSVAIGRDAITTRDSEVSFGNPSDGTRYLAGVRDPILVNDAANKHYVDATTSNSITATVTDTLVTVDDAVAQAPLSLSFEGGASQDGTPSVDTPVEVQVVTQPNVTVADKAATAYEPYSGKTVAITLPKEHPYLASLPDGTADEVVIDVYGNVKLVARVWRNTLTAWRTNGDANYYTCVISPYRADNTVMCSGGIVTKNEKPGDVFVGSALGLIAYQPREGDTPEALNAKALTCYYKLDNVKTYILGKVSLPSLKVGVSNVWIDGGMGGRLTMTYKQDINKVIAGLKSQIAALTSKTASDETSTSGPTIESDPAYLTSEPTVE